MGVTLFDDASLVLIPSGIKDSKVYSVKPDDGTGDLDFSRASSATRVNSAGLIEKVRTNFIRNSSMVGAVAGSPGTLPTNWGATPFAFAGLTRTIIGVGNENGLPYVEVRINGTATGTAASIYTEQTNPASPSQVFANSVYLKYTANPNPAQSVNISTNFFNGVTFVNSQITAVLPTNNLTRFVGIHTASSSPLNLATTSISFVFTIGQSYDFTIRIAAPQMELGDAASDWIPTTTASVTVGPTNNVPRLDYSGGATCPRLLLEAQRTNKITYSENQGPSGTNWFPSTSWTVTNNTVISPSGLQDADTLTETTSNGFHSGFYNAIIDNAYTGTYTISAFAKYNGRFFVLTPKGAVERTFFNLQTGTIALLGGGGVTAKIEDYGNGWYRCSVTCSYTNENVRFEHLLALSAIGAPIYTGDGTSGVHIWGCQAEAGAFVSSYIPTTTAAVTRVVDIAEKFGIGSLIGSPAGTIFLQVQILSLGYGRTFISLQDTSYATNSIRIECTAANRWRIQIRNASTTILDQTISTGSPFTTGNYKIAYAYNTGTDEIAFYANGVSLFTGTAASIPTACVNLFLGSRLSGVYDQHVSDSFDQALLFKTRLTNAQLAELTTL